MTRLLKGMRKIYIEKKTQETINEKMKEKLSSFWVFWAQWYRKYFLFCFYLDAIIVVVRNNELSLEDHNEKTEEIKTEQNYNEFFPHFILNIWSVTQLSFGHNVKFP